MSDRVMRFKTILILLIFDASFGVKCDVMMSIKKTSFLRYNWHVNGFGG